MSASLQSLMRDQLVEDRTAPVLVQLFAFLVIGGAAAIAFVGVSSAAIALFDTRPAWLVSSLCYAGFIVPVYLLHRRYSFQSGVEHARALPRYVAVQLCGLAVATVFSYVAYGVVGLPTLTAAIVVIALTSGINFLVLRRWAFGPA
ncbi:MAG: GtrA family protein [Hyphomonadaceae bacterium]